MAIHTYDVRPRKDKRGVDIICDALPFGKLWYAGKSAVDNAVGYAEFYSRGKGAVVRVFDERGGATNTLEFAGGFVEF